MTAAVAASAAAVLALCLAVGYVLARVGDELHLLRRELERWHDLRPAVVEVRSGLAGIAERSRVAARARLR